MDTGSKGNVPIVIASVSGAFTFSVVTGRSNTILAISAEIAKIVLERPVTTLNVNAPETLAITMGTLPLEPVSMDIDEGVVWQIQTRDLP